MEKIPTAEEFLNSKGYAEAKYIMVGGIDVLRLLEEYSIIKAKFHVKAALEAALESIPCLGSSTDIATYEEVEKEVLNAYPENLIK